MSETEAKSKPSGKSPADPNYGILTDAGIEKLKLKVGIPQPKPTQPQDRKSVV